MEAQVLVPKYKTIRIKKAGGGTRLQKVQVLASGKYKFVKNSTKSRKITTKRRKSTRKGMVRKTARRAYEPKKKRKSTRRKTNKDSMWNW
jgi:hypothetical protein